MKLQPIFFKKEFLKPNSKLKKKWNFETQLKTQLRVKNFTWVPFTHYTQLFLS